MTTRRFTILISSLLFVVPLFAQEPAVVELPAPQTEIGKPLMQALKLRQSSRSFAETPLPAQELSNLLWAAYGINRPESGHRTAPSAMNWQEIDIYVALPEGLYVYEPGRHLLKGVAAGDVRAFTGKQAYVRNAPLNLVYVADAAKMKNAGEDDRLLYTAADAGFIAQNVYLYCASQGLATVVRGMVDRPLLAAKMNLRPEQRILLSQTVGYRK